jgi:hypothetical protein
LAFSLSSRAVVAGSLAAAISVGTMAGAPDAGAASPSILPSPRAVALFAQADAERDGSVADRAWRDDAARDLRRARRRAERVKQRSDEWMWRRAERGLEAAPGKRAARAQRAWRQAERAQRQLDERVWRRAERGLESRSGSRLHREATERWRTAEQATRRWLASERPVMHWLAVEHWLAVDRYVVTAERAAAERAEAERAAAERAAAEQAAAERAAAEQAAAEQAAAELAAAERAAAERAAAGGCGVVQHGEVPHLVAEIFRCRLRGAGYGEEEARRVAAEAVVIARCESSWNPGAVVFNGQYLSQPHPDTGKLYSAAGVFQFIRSTADRWIEGGYGSALDPSRNIDAAARLYLHNRARGLGGWEDWACAAANDGFKATSELPGWPGGPAALPSWAWSY